MRHIKVFKPTLSNEEVNENLKSLLETKGIKLERYEIKVTPQVVTSDMLHTGKTFLTLIVDYTDR